MKHHTTLNLSYKALDDQDGIYMDVGSAGLVGNIAQPTYMDVGSAGRRVAASARRGEKFFLYLANGTRLVTRDRRLPSGRQPSTVNGQPILMRVLIVEDEPKLAERIHAALVRAGMVADIAPDGIEGQFLGETESYDAAVLDLG